MNNWVFFFFDLSKFGVFSIREGRWGVFGKHRFNWSFKWNCD